MPNVNDSLEAMIARASKADVIQYWADETEDRLAATQKVAALTDALRSIGNIAYNMGQTSAWAEGFDPKEQFKRIAQLADEALK